MRGLLYLPIFPMELSSLSTPSAYPLPSTSEIDSWRTSLLSQLAKQWQGAALTVTSEKQRINPDVFQKEAINTILVQELSAIPVAEREEAIANTKRIFTCFYQNNRVIESADERAICDLLRMSLRSYQNPQEFSDLQIRIGFGCSQQPAPNGRLPSYLLAVKRILESMRERVPTLARPKVLLYSADSFVADANQADTEGMQEAAKRNFALLQAYIEHFLEPDVGQLISFDTDMPIERQSSLDWLLDYFTMKLRKTTDPSFEKARGKVIGIGMKNGSTAEDALRYSTAHSLYSGDDIAPVTGKILRDAEAKPKKLFMVGGDKERVFWLVRQAIKAEANIEDTREYFRERIEAEGIISLDDPIACQQEDVTVEYLRGQLICSAGKLPVYGSYAGDWSVQDVASRSFEQLVEDQAMDERMKRDLLAVVADIQGLPLETAYSYKAKKGFDEKTTKLMNEGYEKFRSFCREFSPLQS